MHCHVHSNLNPHSVNVQSTENSAKCLCQPPFTELCVCVCVWMCMLMPYTVIFVSLRKRFIIIAIHTVISFQCS